MVAFLDDDPLRRFLPSIMGDTEQERAVRRADVEALLQDAFTKAVIALGRQEARRLWAKVAAPKRGAPSGSRNKERDAMLLRTYDRLLRLTEAAHPDFTMPVASLPRRLSKELDRIRRRQFGNSADAIEKKLRRLLRAREAQAANARVSRPVVAGFLSALLEDQNIS